MYYLDFTNISETYNDIDEHIKEAIELIKKLDATRARSCVVTKLDEARMWLQKSWNED